MTRNQRQQFLLPVIILGAVGCGEAGPPLGSLESPIVNGSAVDDNVNDVVRVILDFQGSPGTGSGVVWQNEGSVATVVTAAHVVLGGPLEIDLPSSAEIERHDGGVIEETVAGTVVVPHPAAQTSFNVGEGDTFDILKPLDVAVIITEPFSTAENLVTPSLVDPTLLLGSSVDYFGYGPTIEDDPDSAGELNTFTGSLINANALKSRGNVTPSPGTFIEVENAGATAFTQRGDSGGPVFVAGTHELVSLHINRKANAQRQLTHTMRSIGVASVTEWIEAVRTARGKVATGKFSNEKVADQLIVLPGPDWTIHVEHANGTRQVTTVAVDPALGGLQALAGVTRGRFNSDAFEDGLVQLEQSSGQRLVQILNPGEPGATPTPKLLSTTAYTSFSIQRVNKDDTDDVVAQRVGGGQHIYYGSESNGLRGPFGPGTFKSCRNAGSHRANACGGNNGDSSCSCSIACLSGQGSNCCSDVVEVCQAASKDELITSAEQLGSSAGATPATSGGAQPLVKVTGAAGTAAGVLLSKDWALLPKDQGTATGLSLSQQSESGELALSVKGVIGHPNAPLALARIAPSTEASVPDGHRIRFYAGSAEELLEEDSVHAFGKNPADAEYSEVTYPRAAVVAPNHDKFGVAFDFDLVETDDLVSSALALPPGSPVLSSNGSLVSVTLNSVPEALHLTEGDVEITLHEQLPFVALNTQPGDDRKSARYFIQQVLVRDELRDFDHDALQDLWVFQRPTVDFFPSLLAVPFSTENVAGTGAPAAPAIADDGNWRFVGRARVGAGTTAVVWHELDTGDVQIWKMNSDGEVTASVDLNVAPPWELRALEDIDGDGIADWIWTNAMFDTSFFWLMRDMEAFPDTAALSDNPADLIRYGQWFSGMPLNTIDGSMPFELVAADHFPVIDEDVFPTTGPEQAAGDLVWQEVEGDGTVVWSMTLVHRTCDEIGDPLILADCVARGDSVLTYELTLSNGVFARPAQWRFSGTADYNTDGRPDLVWHARGPDAPPEDVGKVQLWLSRADGEFDEVTVTRNGAPFIVDPAEGLEVAVR